MLLLGRRSGGLHELGGSLQIQLAEVALTHLLEHAGHIGLVLGRTDLHTHQPQGDMTVDQHQEVAIRTLDEVLDELLRVHLGAGGLTLLLLLAIGDLGELQLLVAIPHADQNVPDLLVVLHNLLVPLGQLLRELVRAIMQILGGEHPGQGLGPAVSQVTAQGGDLSLSGRVLPQLDVEVLDELGLQLRALGAGQAVHLLVRVDAVDLLLDDGLLADAILLLLTLVGLLLLLLGDREDVLDEAGIGDRLDAEQAEHRLQIGGDDLVPNGVLIVQDEHQNGRVLLAPLPGVIVSGTGGHCDQEGHGDRKIGALGLDLAHGLGGLLAQLLQALLVQLAVLLPERIDLVVGGQDCRATLILDNPLGGLEALLAVGTGLVCRDVLVVLEDSLGMLLFTDDNHYSFLLVVV